MLLTIERCWFVGIRMLLRRRKCAVWRPSDYMRWNDCFKEERAVTVQARGIVCHTPPLRGKSTIMVSLSFQSYLSARFADESLFSVHANSAYLNVNYRVITASFYCRGSESGTVGYSTGITGFAQPALVQTRKVVLLDSVLGTVFQFVTSFAPTIVRAILQSSHALVRSKFR